MRKKIIIGVMMWALLVMTATPALAIPAKPVITIVNPDGGILMQNTLQYTSAYQPPKIKEPLPPTSATPTVTVQVSGAKSAAAATTSRSNTGVTRQIVQMAHNQLGKGYVAGGNGPNSFDCSGLTKYIYQNAGISIPRTAASQYQAGIRVSRGELVPGDLVFFSNSSTSGIGHVGLYVGDNYFIHASTPKTGVIKSSLNEGYYTRNYKGAARFAR